MVEVAWLYQRLCMHAEKNLGYSMDDNANQLPESRIVMAIMFTELYPVGRS